MVIGLSADNYERFNSTSGRLSVIYAGISRELGRTSVATEHKTESFLFTLLKL